MPRKNQTKQEVLHPRRRRAEEGYSTFGRLTLAVRAGALGSCAAVAPRLSAQNSPGNALPPLAPAYGEIPPSFWEIHGHGILLASFGLLLLVGAAVWLLARPRPPVAAPPAVVARENLAALRRRPEDGQALSHVSQILRRYLRAAFGLPAGEAPTGEFCATLAASDKVGAELAQAVAGFLRECDRRKFAPVPTEAVAPFEAAARALALIEQAELRLRQTTTPSPGEA